MLGHPTFYHGTLKRAILCFGTLFNDITIKRVSSDSAIEQSIKVPISFVSRDRMLSRVQEFPDHRDSKVAVTLPRMCFDLSGEYAYDAQRALGRTRKMYNPVGNEGDIDVAFTPVPWSIGFELSLLTLSQEDSIQVLEQILPFFKPDFTVSMISEVGQSHDITFTLQSVNSNLDVVGSFESRNIIEYTLTFNAVVWFYGPVSRSGVIKKVVVETEIPPSSVVTQTVEAIQDEITEEYTFEETTIELL